MTTEHKPTKTPDRSTWVQHEAGWYTLAGVGGISKERYGWAFWPIKGEPVRGLKTMKDAKRVAILGHDNRRSEGWTREQSGDWRG